MFETSMILTMKTTQTQKILKSTWERVDFSKIKVICVTEGINKTAVLGFFFFLIKLQLNYNAVPISSVQTVNFNIWS